MTTTLSRPLPPTTVTKTKSTPPRRPSLQVRTSSLRNVLSPSRHQSNAAITKTRNTTSRPQHLPPALLTRLATSTPVTEAPSIHDNIWRFQERLREMGSTYLYSGKMPADLYVVAIPIDGLPPQTPVSGTAPSSAENADFNMRKQTRSTASVNIRARIHPASGGTPILVRRTFNLTEARSTIPEARRLPMSPRPQIAPTPPSQASSARKTLFELGITSPVVGPRSAVALTHESNSLLSPFVYQAPVAIAGQSQSTEVAPPSPFPVSPFIGFERRKRMASLAVMTGTIPPVPEPKVLSATTKKGFPMHLEFARSYLPILAALMLSDKVGERDTVELCVPHPEAWEDTVTHVYTGRPLMSDKIRANIRYLGGKPSE